jgi:prepilin-type N-terminal cleavage/methylation domain-containing protein
MLINQNLGERQGPTRQRGGFTLVEVLCAIVVTAIAATALFAGFDNGFGVLRTTREDLRATQIMMQKTEAIRLLPWNLLTNANGSFQENYYPPGTAFTNGGTLYYGTFNTMGVPATIPDTVTYKSNLHLITVTLSWTNFIGTSPVPHFRYMQSLYTLNGLQSYVYGTSTNN